MNGIQTQVNAGQAPAVAGDFASGNPRAFVNAGQGALVAGPGGMIVGTFGWLSYSAMDNDNAPAIVNNFGAGPVAGILHRQQQGLIIQYLADAAMYVVPGTQLALMNEGDIWVVNSGAAAAYIGQKAYANFANGLASFAATGAAGVASATGSIAAGAGASATGTIAGNLFTAVSGLSGTFVAGGTLSGTNVVANTQIIAQVLPLLAGEALGGLGRYTVNTPQTVASTAISEAWGVFTAASALVGTFGAGQPLTGTSVPAGTVIQSQLTGTAGGLGTYITNKTGTASSTTISAGTNVETKWVAMSQGQPGELIKISSWPLG